MIVYSIYILIFSMAISNDQENNYVDLEGNEIIYKNNQWRYVSKPEYDCNIPYIDFVTYIKEHSNQEFSSDEEAFRYGKYQIPHIDVCPPFEYKPNIYPVNIEYALKANWDSLKVGMSQKQVISIFKFDPLLSYEIQNTNIWKYYGFGYLEFNNKGRLLDWEYTGSNNLKIYSNTKKETDSNNNENKINFFNKILNKIKKILPL